MCPFNDVIQELGRTLNFRIRVLLFPSPCVGVLVLSVISLQSHVSWYDMGCVYWPSTQWSFIVTIQLIPFLIRKFCPWCGLGLCVCLYVSCWGRAVGLSIQTAGPWKSLAGTWLRTPSPRNTELSTWARWKGFRGYKLVSRLCLP